MDSARGPVAMLNALPLPAREGAGGGLVAASDTSAKQGTVLRVLSWPVLVLGGFGLGLLEMPAWLVGGLVETVAFGHLDILPADARPLTLATIRPRFLAQLPGDTASRCGAER